MEHVARPLAVKRRARLHRLRLALIAHVQELEQERGDVDAGARERIVALALCRDEPLEDVGVMLSKVDEVGEAEDAHPSKVLGRLGRLEAEVYPTVGDERTLGVGAEGARPQPREQLHVLLLARVVRRALE